MMIMMMMPLLLFQLWMMKFKMMITMMIWTLSMMMMNVD